MNTKAKLEKLARKFDSLSRIAAKLGCRKVAAKWSLKALKIEAKIDKIIPYKWETNNTVLNLENGKRYNVLDSWCSCPSFQHKTGLVNGTCKHIRMRAEVLGINLEQVVKPREIISVNLKELPAGTWAERTSDWISKEWQVFCYEEKRVHGEWSLQNKSLGFITEDFEGRWVSARTFRSASRNFSNTNDAVRYLIRYNNLTLQQVAECYASKHNTADDFFWFDDEVDEQLDVHVDESDRTPAKKWMSIEDLETLPW